MGQALSACLYFARMNAGVRIVVGFRVIGFVPEKSNWSVKLRQAYSEKA